MILYLVLGAAFGIAATLFFQKFVLKTFDKVEKAVSDVKTDLK